MAEDLANDLKSLSISEPAPSQDAPEPEVAGTNPNPKAQHPLYKTKHCYFFYSGFCRFGDNCRFNHEVVEGNEQGILVSPPPGHRGRGHRGVGVAMGGRDSGPGRAPGGRRGRGSRGRGGGRQMPYGHCFPYLQTGVCPYGQTCPFLHYSPSFNYMANQQMLTQVQQPQYLPMVSQLQYVQPGLQGLNAQPYYLSATAGSQLVSPQQVISPQQGVSPQQGISPQPVISPQQGVSSQVLLPGSQDM